MGGGRKGAVATAAVLTNPRDLAGFPAARSALDKVAGRDSDHGACRFTRPSKDRHADAEESTGSNSRGANFWLLLRQQAWGCPDLLNFGPSELPEPGPRAKISCPRLWRTQ